MKSIRILLGILIVLGAAFIIVGEQLARASSHAVVNARLTTVRAPIAGRLDLEPKALGSLVEQGELLGRLEDPLVDVIRLNDLLLEREMAETERNRISEQISAINDSLDILSNRADSYRTERIRSLEAEAEAGQSRLASAQARVDEARGALERSRQLADRGVDTTSNLERVQANMTVAERFFDEVKSNNSATDVQLSAARKGVFLGDSYNDAPYSEQRSEELDLQRRELENELEAVNARISSLIERIARERRRVNDLAAAQIDANVNGRVWSVLAAGGERLERGQDVMRLVDCASTMITLSVPESVYNRLRIGDTGEFRLNGSESVYHGTVSRLAGSGAATIYQNLAVAPSRRALEQFDVTLLLSDLSREDQLSCAIGRTGRVFFESRPLDQLRSFVAELFN